MSLGASWTAGERMPDVYRYSVRCDRAMNAAIEKAAKSAGVTASQYVQQHFETILDRRVEAGRDAPPQDEEIRTARSCGITVGMLRVHRAMKTRASLRGSYGDGVEALADATGYTPSSVRVLMSKLEKYRLIQRLQRGGAYGAARYHVFSIGDD